MKTILIFFSILLFPCFGGSEVGPSAKIQEIQRTLSDGTRKEIHEFFGFLDREIRSGKMKPEEKIEISKILYTFRYDERGETIVSEDEIAGSVNSAVLGAMINLTDYQNVIDPNPGNKDPFRSHPLNRMSLPGEKKAFFEWFEKKYLNGEKPAHQQLKVEEMPQSELASSNINRSASPSKPDGLEIPRGVSQEEPTNRTRLYWVLSLPMIAIFVIIFKAWKGKRMR
jgi:hypothetical protein